MLSCDQIAELAGAVCATAEAMGQTISAGGAQIIAEDLAAYEQRQIVDALRACRREPAGRLSLGMILKHLQAADGRPGKDEAWGIALTGFDERETVVLTEEIRTAMNAAQAIFDAGDKVGARMAFMSAYERLITQARAEAVPVKWDVSLGFDTASRALAIETAVRMQLLPQERAAQYREHMSIPALTPDGQAIAGLLTGDVCEASPAMREKLTEARKAIAEGKAKSEKARRKKAQADRVNTYLRKRQVRAALAELNSRRGAA